MNKGALSVVLAGGLLAAGAGSAEGTLTVGAGETYTVSGSESYDAVDLLGEMTVPSGASIVAVSNAIGRTGSARLVVDGGTFGVKDSDSHRVWFGENGGSPLVSVKDGKFASGHFYVCKNAAASASGYIDVIETRGTVTLDNRTRYNQNTSKTARIRVLSGTTRFISDNGWSEHHFGGNGSWRIEVAGGATACFDQMYHEGDNVALNGYVAITFAGDGDVQFKGATSAKSFTVGAATDNGLKVRFDQTGKISILTAPVTFNPVVVFGNSLSSLELGHKAIFKSAVNLPTVIAKTADGILSGTVAVTFGAGDRNSSVTGAVFAVDSQLTVRKTGSGELTISDTTPYFPATTVEGGCVRVCGDFSCAGMTLAEGTKVVVDGGSLTIDGNQLTASLPASVVTTNRGSIVLKTYADNAPDLSGIAELAVRELWIDGVRQANGTHKLGSTTVTVDHFDDEGIWTNESDTTETYDFPANSDYSGMLLKTPPTALTLTGAVRLGSAGIAVADGVTAETTNVFDLAITPVKTATWSFGASSATFLRPFLEPTCVAEEPALTLNSEGTVAFAADDSTFAGKMSVSAYRINVTGRDAFGPGDATATLQVAHDLYGASSAIRLTDAEFNRPMTLSCVSTHGNVSDHRANIVLAGHVVFNRAVSMSDECTQFTVSKDATVEFNGGMTWKNYGYSSVGDKATVVFRDKLKLDSYYGAGTFYPCVAANGHATFVFDCPVTQNKTHNLYFERADVVFLRDSAFTSGNAVMTTESVIRLNGHDQCLTTIRGGGQVSSTNVAAVLDFAVAADTVLTNASAFVDLAGTRVVGPGEMRLTKVSSSAGVLGATNGTLTVAADWSNAAVLEVAEKGTVAIAEGVRVGGMLEAISLAGTGGLANDSGRKLKTAKLTLVNPVSGEEHVYADGLFNASNSFGLIKSGSVQVGTPGVILIVR